MIQFINDVIVLMTNFHIPLNIDTIGTKLEFMSLGEGEGVAQVKL